MKNNRKLSEEKKAYLDELNKRWDSYFFTGTKILKNNLNIYNEKKLAKTENYIVQYKSSILDQIINISYSEEFSEERLKAIHHFLFCDIYDWAGKYRDVDIFKNEDILNGKSVDYLDYEFIEKNIKSVMEGYNNDLWNGNIADKLKLEIWSDLLVELWKTHAFREGNTRTCVAFSLQFAKSIHLELNSEYFYNHSSELRDALCLYADGRKNNLISFVKHAFEGETELSIVFDKTNIQSHENMSFKSYSELIDKWIDEHYSEDKEINHFLKINSDYLIQKMMSFYAENRNNVNIVENTEMLHFKTVCDDLLENNDYVVETTHDVEQEDEEMELFQ